MRLREDQYDLCIIGGGPGGYAAAMRAIDFGKKVLLIEKEKVGGAEIYNGALTSKTMWELSEKVAYINGVLHYNKTRAYEISWEEVQRTVNQAVFEKKLQYSIHLKLLQTDVQNPKLHFVKGRGTMLAPNQVQITMDDGTEKIIHTEFIIIATGSKPRKVDNIAVDEKIIMTSDGIHHLQDYPKSLVILGAGVIGCEYATIFANFGKTKVYIIDRADRILPFEDQDIASVVAENLQKRGVTIHQHAQLTRMEVVNGEVEYEILYDSGLKETIRVEKALLSVGRTPNIENIGLENAGVQMSKRGIHIGDSDTQTNVKNIFTVGDVKGRIALVNMAEIEGRHAVEKMFGHKTQKLNYDNVSTIMFLKPEVASVGVNEKYCIEHNIPVRVAKLDYSLISRAIAMRSTEGFFKIIVTDDDDMKVLGMRAIGAHASSAIEAVALLIQMNKGIEELAEMIHPHPSITEGIQECIRMLLKKSLLKPVVFKEKLSCYRLKDGVKTPFYQIF